MDIVFSQWMNALLGRSLLFDEAVLTLSSSHLAKGGMLVAVLLFVWFWIPAGREKQSRRYLLKSRVTILAALMASVFGEIFARLLSHFSPFRLRPFLESSLDMQVPEKLQMLAPEMMTNSSFPSDHAILFFAMTTGVFLISRTIGLFAFLYSTVFIALPRIYLGLHFMSDILIGALIGVTFTLVGVRLMKKAKLLRWPVIWSFSKPAIFSPLFFLFLFQVATMLEDLRAYVQLFKLL